MKSRFARSVAVVGAAALVMGAFVAAPAEAKKKKKKKVVVACAPYTTPEWAEGDVTTTTVTNAATADAPLEVTIPTEPGLGFTSNSEPHGGDGAPSAAYHNIVVDSAAASAKLFIRAEYAQTWDYDLYLRAPDAVALAWEGDFNPATANGPTPVASNQGGHPEPGASQIDGYESVDCSGFTIELAGGITPGGDVAVTIWLEP